jgi:hypothetical protein
MASSKLISPLLPASLLREFVNGTVAMETSRLFAVAIHHFDKIAQAQIFPFLEFLRDSVLPRPDFLVSCANFQPNPRSSAQVRGKFLFSSSVLISASISVYQW